MVVDNIRQISVSELVFDLRNPRLPEFDLTSNSSEQEVIRVLWDTMDVNELVLSISASGFFPHEHLIVAEEDGQNVVIEGNRRLAAVKVLLDPKIARFLNANIPPLSEQQQDALSVLPVVFATREDSWRYLGFKHVNGPAKWSSYAKSRYIADVRKKHGAALDDIARQLGDTHRTVQRLFRGLMVIEQAELLKIFDRADRWRSHFSFSHVYTGLSYPGISNFLGIQSEGDETESPVPAEKREELRELLLWLYGSKRDSIRPVVESQNPHLRQLEKVVSSREALAALRDNGDLAIAFELSRPSSTVFEEALLSAKRSLQKAQGLLSTSYDGSDELLRISSSVADMAADLYDAMELKRRPRKRSRKAEDG